jgi:hypothetical protein
MKVQEAFVSNDAVTDKINQGPGYHATRDRVPNQRRAPEMLFQTARCDIMVYVFNMVYGTAHIDCITFMPTIDQQSQALT